MKASQGKPSGRIMARVLSRGVDPRNQWGIARVQVDSLYLC